MKKGKSIVLLIGLSCLLTACSMLGSKTSKDGKSGESTLATIAIKSGEFIIPEDTDIEDGTGYLALEIMVKNKTKKSLSIISSDISLYDKEDNMIEMVNFYPPEGTVKPLNYDKIASNKSKTGYIVFEVDKDSKYELHFAPEFYELGSGSKTPKEIVLKIDTSTYKENTKEVIPAATAFVDTIFLNRENADYDKLMSNKKDEVIGSFNSNFTKALAGEFYDYVPTDAELNKTVESFKTANGKVAEIDYQIMSYYPNYAEIAVKPKVLSFDNMDASLEEISDKFLEEKRNSGDYNYDTIYVDAEKHLLESMPAMFDSSSIEEADDYEEGYLLVLKKKDGKWAIDVAKSNSNYEYGYLEEVFRGGLYN